MSSRPTSPEQNKRVLVIDDDEPIRRLLISVLEQQSLSVDAAANGEQAISLLTEHRYAVVLVDLLMPGIDGFAILDHLARFDAHSSPVVMVVTGADRRTIGRLDAQRIHGIVKKPFDPQELARLVVACAEIKSRNTFNTMAIATMLGGPLMAILSTKL
jgi:CheY-like chemotaxis protein